MVVGNKNLCPLCFEEISEGEGICHKCNEKNYSKPDTPVLAPGTVLNGKYLVGRTLGRGGFGVTYLCYNIQTNDRFALKEFFPRSFAHRDVGSSKLTIYDDDRGDFFRSGCESFLDEAKIISRLNHNENVVKIYGMFYENNTAYYVMEYLEGIDMKKYIESKGGKLSEKETLEIMSKVFSAVSAVHGLNFLHRDIAPDNIFICNDGGVKLIDFGTAKHVVSEQSQSLEVVCKSGFTPFEQYKSHGNQGPWTDIYALGATMYYALTGKVLLDAPSRTDNPQIDFDSISDGLENVIRRMLSVYVEYRYKSIREVKDAIYKALSSVPSSVRYYSNGGTGNMDYPTQTQVGDTFTVPGCSFTKQGYKFVSWSTTADGQGYRYNAGSTITLEKDVKLYAQWEKIEKEGYSMGVKIALALGSLVAVVAVIVIVFVLSSFNKTSEGDPIIPTSTAEGYSFVNSKGKTVVTLDEGINEFDGFIHGVAAVKKGDKYGLINTKGEIVSDFLYDDIEFDNAIVVEKDGKEGIINTSGEVIVPCVYDDVVISGMHVEVIHNFKTFGYTLEKSLSGTLYDCKETYPEALFLDENSSGEGGYVNIRGEVVIKHQYKYAHEFNDGLASVCSTVLDKFGYIDTSGNTVIDFEYDYANYYGCGFACVMKGDQWGYIRKDSSVAIPFTSVYETAFDFEPEGYALVKNGDYYGAINTSGKMIAETKYSFVSAVTDELLCVENDSDSDGLIDMNGQVLLDLEYSSINSSFYNRYVVRAEKNDIDYFYTYVDGKLQEIDGDVVGGNEEYIIISKNSEQGVVDKYGKEVLPLMYKKICVGDGDVFAVERGTLWGCVDADNKTLLDFKFFSAFSPGTY